VTFVFSIHLPLIRGSRSKSEPHPSLSPAILSSSYRRIPRCSRAKRNKQSFQQALVCPGISSTCGRALKTSKGTQPEGILIKCLNYLIWLFSMQKCSGSTSSSSQMYEFLTIFLRLSPATFQSKLISAACIGNLSLYLMRTSMYSIGMSNFQENGSWICFMIQWHRN